MPDIPSWSARDYGNRVGVFRLMQVMDRHGIRGTVALNSDLCAHHPEIIEEGQKLGWEWMGHCESNTRRLNEAPPGEERGIIRRTLRHHREGDRHAAAGWLGSGLQETWNTLDLLAAAGCEYVCDWTNDDQPYLMTLDGGRQLVAMPYSHEINDKPAFEKFHRTADEFREMICRQFDVLYREGAESGRVMAIALHPISPACRTASTRSTRRSVTSASMRGSGRRPGARSRDTISRRWRSHRGVEHGHGTDYMASSPVRC